MLQIVVRQLDNDVSLVIVRGEIDVQSFAPLDGALAQLQGDGRTSVVLDLSEVTFLDSIGLGVLIAAKRRARRARRGFALVVEPQGAIARVLDQVGIADGLSVFGTRDMARAVLRNALSEKKLGGHAAPD